MILTQPPQTSSPVSDQPITPLYPQPNPQPLKWLWPGRIPQGKLTLLDSAPGCGTTLFAITLAAHVSTGQPWPDGTPCPQGKVLFITPHDDFRDTLLPRLKTAGARKDHVLSFTHLPDPAPNAPQRTRPFSFARDLPLLERTITTQGITLLIIDPYTALPGWRRALPSLIALAQRTHCAIVLTRSLSRPPSNPLQPRCPASTALTAAHSHLLMSQAGELISLDRGLYTTSDHPCLSKHMPASPTSTSTPADSHQNVPNVPADFPSSSPKPADSYQNVPTVANSPTCESGDKTARKVSTSQSEPVAPSSSPTPQPRPSDYPTDPLMQLFKHQLALQQDLFARVQATTRLAQKKKPHVPITL